MLVFIMPIYTAYLYLEVMLVKFNCLYFIHSEDNMQAIDHLVGLIINFIFLHQYYLFLAVPCNIILDQGCCYCMHGPCGYAISYQPRCALIRIDTSKH